MKKIINIIFGFVGLIAVVLCTALAIKTPNVFKELFGMSTKDSVIQSVPYYVNFGDLGTSDSSYKTQYFKYANRQWYLSWGNHGQQKDHDLGDGDVRESFNMLLGWNATKHPTYGSYSYVEQVMKNIKVADESFNYSYLIMDFDFNLNHQMEWSFSAFENLTKSDTTLYLISSHDKGISWSVADQTKDVSLLSKKNEIKFTLTEESVISRTTRYGLVLVSNAESARIELNQFIVSRLSLA